MMYSLDSDCFVSPSCNSHYTQVGHMISSLAHDLYVYLCMCVIMTMHDRTEVHNYVILNCCAANLIVCPFEDATC